MSFMDKEHQDSLKALEMARLARAAQLGTGTSGIKRESKRRNAPLKRKNHEANQAAIRMMNQAADKSEGKSPRPTPGMRA